MPTELQSRMTKEVAYRYRGHELRIPLTHALFSSAGVDSGTNQLLTVLARQFSERRFQRIADIGSGTGVLGVPLAKAHLAPLRAIDRDALAVVWTDSVARRNGVEGVATHAITADGIDALDGTLVVSNMPAKAGQPVLDGMLSDICRLGSSAGSMAAVVVVRPLSGWLLAALQERGVAIIAESSSANHHSIVFEMAEGRAAGMKDGSVTGIPSRFVRIRDARFVGPSGEYTIDTAFNIPEFDQLSFRLALAFDLLRSVRVSGTVCVRGVRQGHLVVGLSQRSTDRMALTLCDRDLLALRITEHNCAGRAAISELLPIPTLASFSDARCYDWLVVDEDPEPGTPWDDETVAAIENRIVPGGKLLLVGRSTTLTRVAKKARSRIKSISERRMRGYRAELFVRKR